MTEDTDTQEAPNYLGIDAKRVVQTGKGTRSGRRVLAQEQNPLTKIRGGDFGGFKFYEQDFRSEASSSIWKEYLLDKKPATGVLLDNNVLLWFPTNRELRLQKALELARDKYPDTKVVARFNFGDRTLGMAAADVAIRSSSEVFDAHMDSLVSYFGRSLDWQEGVQVSLFYASKEKGQFDGSLQEYLVHQAP